MENMCFVKKAEERCRVCFHVRAVDESLPHSWPAALSRADRGFPLANSALSFHRPEKEKQTIRVMER